MSDFLSSLAQLQGTPENPEKPTDFLSQLNSLQSPEPNRSLTGNRISAGIDQYQAGLLGLGEAVAGKVGATGVEESLRERREQNESAAEAALRQARAQGGIESYKDVTGVGSALNYVGGLAAQSLPYVGESLVGGIGARALMGGTKAALRGAIEVGDVAGQAAARSTLAKGSLLGGTAASYPSAVGDVLSNQRDQSGETNLGTAAALGVPYAALNAFGVEGALAKQQGFRVATDILDSVSGVKGAIARGVTTGVGVGAQEAVSETAQEALNQVGRMSVDPTEKFLNERSKEAFLESAVGGFALGGLAGSVGGGMRRSQGSFLPGSTDSGSLDVSSKPDNNAINKAIDENSTDLPAKESVGSIGSLTNWTDENLNATLDFQKSKGPNANQALVQQLNDEIARRGGAGGQQEQQAQLDQARAQAQQQAAQVAQQQAQVQQQQAQEAFTQVAQTYGLKPGTQAGQFNVAGKILFTQNDAVNFLKSLDELNAGKTEEQKGIIGATLASGAVKVNADANPKTINNAVNKFLTGFGLDSAVNKTEAAERANTIISTMEGGTTLKKAEPLNNFYRSVTGQDAPAFTFLVQQTEATKPTKPKGVQDGQLQVQDNAGLRAVSEQGGTTQTSGNQPGNVRPPSVQSIESGSVGAGSLGLQTGAVPSSGISTSTNTGGSGINISNAGAQAQGQVNEAQRTGSDQEGRGALSGQAIEGNRTPEQQAEETATNIVESVIKGVIDAVVTRKGRMSKENLAKLKEFIYYDASQIEDQKNGLPGLSKKELSEMFGVSTDVIDGWQDISRNFFEQNRGVIQAQIYQALDKNGITLLELKEAVQAKRDTTLNDAIILEEGQRKEASTKDDEQADKTKAGKTVAAADQELTEVDESQLDQRDLGAEDSGMTVMTGRKGASVQEQNKPEETINAKYIRKSKELEKAENAGDEELVDKLNKELNDLVDEAAGIAKKQVAKSEAIASEKKKETKDAVQKRSTKGVSVRKQAEVSEGVPSKDTEGGKTAAKGKADEESRSLTIAKEPNEIADDELQEKKKAANQVGLNNFYTVIDQLSTYENLNEAIYSAEQNAIDTINEDKSFREKDNTISLSVYNAATNAIAKEVEAYTWNQLKAPVSYEQLSPQAKADWALSVRDGKTNLAAASKVYEDNQKSIQKQLDDDSRTIDGTELITEVGEQKQFLMLTNQVNKLNEAQISRLEKHYGEKRDTPDFLQSLKEDVIRYIDISAEAVAGAIRDIIKSIANGVMAMAVVFNPTMVSQPFQFAVPTYETKTVEVVAPVPAEVAQVMSPAAKRAYEVIYPTIKDQLVKNDKLFVVTDKPTATNFIFSPDGKVLFQSKVLIGKTEGNYYKGNNNVVANRITPAGLYNMGMRTGGKTAADYDFNKVFGVEQIEDGQKYFVTMMHSVYTKESDAGQRVAALKEAGPQNSRYSFGCINVDKETFGKILAGHEKQMDGAKLFIVPDGNENVMEFINGKAVYSSDMVREKAEPILKTEKVPTQGTGTTERTLSAKEEKATEETTKLSSKSKKFYFDEIEDTERGFDSIRKNLAELGIENSLDFVSDWSFVDIKGGEPGAIESLGGRYVVTVNNNAEFTDAYIAETARHELGHAVDMAPHGGIYSAQQEMGVALKNGVVTPVGAVAREMHNLYKNDIVWNEFLAYPFDAKTFTDLDTHVKIEAELFAQLFTVYTNPKGRAKLEAEAPIAAAYMKEVINDIKSTKALQIQKAETAAERVVRFQNRNAGQRKETTGGPLPERGQDQELKLYSRSAASQFDTIREQAKSNLDKIPSSIRGPFRAIHDALFSAKETALSVMLTIDVAKMASKYMPSAMDYFEVNNKRSAIESAITEKLDKILVTAQDDLNSADRVTVNRLIEDSTISGKWAFDPNIAGVTDKDIDPELAARFKAIGNPKAKQVIRDVFKFWNETLMQEQEAIRAEIDATFAERLANATETEKKAIEARKKDVLDKFSSILKAKSNSPYAPLKRFGPFVVVAKSQEYIDAEKNLDAKWLKENQADEKHYVVEFAETSSEAEAMYDSLKKLGYDQVEKPFKKSESKDVLYSSIDLYKAFTQLKKTISAEKAVSNTAESVDLYSKMNELVDELYLTSLSEASARKSELQRKGIAGLNRALSGDEARDMLRASFSQGAAKAKHIANLRTNDESLQTMIRMQKEAQSNRAEAYPYLNELIAREAQSLQVRERSMLDGVNRLTGDWFLTFSPGFYFQQAAQTYVLSVPWLAGKVDGNYGKAFGAVTTAYKDIMPLVKGSKLREHLDFSKAPKDVREMLENLVSRGAINIGIESELLSHRSVDENVVTATYNKVTNKLRGGINRIEALNRASAATAAYRLEMAKSGSKEKATQAAFDVVKETHGLYDGSNTPRLFNKNAFTRSIFQFRRFQIIQLTTLARIMKDAVAGAGPLEKAIARKQFAFMVGHSLALAGVKGLPLYGLASLAYTLGKAAFGDEDDPKDFEAWLRTHGGLLLARGIPAFMGVDVSGKLGQGNVTSVLPYTDIDLTSRGGIEKLVIGLAGPFAGGLLPKMADGAGLMLGGQYYKGLEQVLPNGFGGVMKGARFTTEGITNRRGDLVMSPDEISFADGMMQALGLPTTKLSERQYLQGQLIKTDQFYNDKATEIKGSYTRAVKEGDVAASKEAQADWKSLQASRKENGYTVQPLSVLLKAPQEQKKRERNTVGGVAVTKSNKGFAQRTSEQT